jgi:glutamyl-tRNA synthetase
VSTTPRVRFCPAPSGWLHVGSVRAALYNWLHARREGGTFVFRIEDTDASRATDESMRSMTEALRWMGLDWDEGPEVGGDYGPYRQSERGDLYAVVARRLEEAGHAYRDYRTKEELEAWREQTRGGEGPPVVKAENFEHAPDEVAAYAEEGRAPSLRLRTPAAGEILVEDLIRGEVVWAWDQISDPVIQRSDGTATYPLANCCDDLAQGITLICRGEDLLSVTPRQVLLYDLLTRDGLLDAALDEVGLPPRAPSWGPPSSFAHLPMVVGMDRKKLSKRHGSVAVQEFARQGFLPGALRNYLALLGWAPRDGRERLTDEELIAEFDLGAVGRAAAAFDVEKLTAFNGERIREMDAEQLSRALLPFLDGTYGDALVATPPTDEQMAVLQGLVPLVQERMQRLDEVQRYAPAFFAAEVELDSDSVAKVFKKAGASAAIEAARKVLADVEWTVESIEGALRGLSEELGIGFGKVAQPIRVAVTGSSVSPPLFESIELLPRDTVLARLDAALPVARETEAG